MFEKFSKFEAEAFGTAALVLFGCGAAVFGGATLGLLGIAIAFGLVIVAMAYVIGPVSGCHINPAVSFAMLINKRITLKEFCFYVIAQIIGAIAGAAILWGFLHLSGMEMAVYGLGENFFGNLNWYGAFIVEVVLTFVFITAIMGVTGKHGNPGNAGLVIGFTLILIHILGIPLTGTSVNPARSLGPAIFVGGQALEQVWVFLLAPLVGGALAAIYSKTFLKTEDKK